MSNATTAVTAKHNGRTFEITSSEKAGAHLAERLISKGFEPNLYLGTSNPTGRQRRSYTGMFYRRNDGAFVSLA